MVMEWYVQCGGLMPEYTSNVFEFDSEAIFALLYDVHTCIYMYINL